MPASEFQSQPHVLTAERRWITLAGVALVAAAFAVYWNSLSAPFVFDDREAILENATIRQLWPPSAVLAPPAGGSGVVGRPIVNLTLALNYALGGESVVGYHLFNVALHACAGLVLFGLMRRTLRRQGYAGPALHLSFATALLWLVHPLQTESVTCVVQRTEVIVSLFYLLVLYALARSAEPGASRGWQVLAVGASALGMASKEVMVTAPVLALLYDRTFFAGTFREAWRKRAGLHGALMATWLVLAWLLWKMGGSRGEAAGFGLGMTWWSYALKQCEAILHYLRLTVWPWPLVIDYGTDVVTNPLEVWPQILGVIALVTAAAITLRVRPAMGFTLAAFFVLLAPSSSVVPLVAQTVAEHRMYLPLALVIAGGVLALHAWRGRWILPAGLAVAAGLGAATVRRNAVYQNAESLWRDTLARVPNNPRAHLCLAMELLRAGRAAEAEREFLATLQLNPWEPTAHNNLGQLLAERGDLPGAIAHYETAAKVKPGFAEIHSNLCDALREAGRVEEAVREGEAAVKLKSNFAEAHSNLGLALVAAGRMTEGIAHYREALRLKPDYVTAGNNLAVAMMNAGDLTGALAEIERVLRTNPREARAHNTRAVVLANLGRRDEAESELEAALRLKPDDAEARENLRRLRATK